VAAPSNPAAEDVDRAVEAAQLNYAPQWYHYFGDLADKIEGAVIPIDKPDTFNFTRNEPLGVAAAITPWNSPLLLAAWKLAPSSSWNRRCSPTSSTRCASPRKCRTRSCCADHRGRIANTLPVPARLRIVGANAPSIRTEP